MGTKTCLSPLALSRAFSIGADAALHAHLQACPSCAETWRQFETLAKLGKALPFSAPERDRRQELHTRLILEAERLHRAPKRPANRRRDAALFMAAAALIACVFGARALWIRKTAAPVAESRRGAIFPQGGASFTHHVTLRDEVVYLTDGTIRAEVQPLQTGERFRVLVGASEIEVKGTVFEVTAKGGELQSVRVWNGLVAVRKVGTKEIYLASGQSWPTPLPGSSVRESSTATAAPTPTHNESTAAPPEGRPAPERLPLQAKSPLRKERTPLLSVKQEQREVVGKRDAEARQRDIDAAFGAGFGALRHKQFREAAAAFGRAAAAAEKQPIAEDAWYWHAVSLGRAGRSEEATGALRGFLARYPRSARFGEVSCMLGWFLYKAEQLDAAATCFQAAQRDRSAEVRESARLGLAAVAARRGQAGQRSGPPG